MTANISPRPSLILAIRNKAGTWPTMLRELIDNAVDAGAVNVALDWCNKDQLVITDDGRGCEDPLRMLTSGHRQDYATTGAGMYGVGGKEAMIWLAKKSSIVSVANGVRRSVFVDWDSLAAKEEWYIDDVEVEPSEGPSGTTITLYGLTHPLPRSWEDLSRSLGRTYAPAIRESRLWLQIRRPRQAGRFEAVAAEPQPDLDGAVTKEVLVGGKRKARVTMGILTRPDQQTLQGMWLALEGGRLLGGKTRTGLGSDPTPGLYGYAELSPRRAWGVNTLKDGIHPAAAEDLGATIAEDPSFAAVIERSRRSGHDVRLDQVNEVLGLLTEEIRSSARREKARRGPASNPTGAVEGTGDGPRHRRARRTQPGERFGSESRQSAKLSVLPRDFGESGPLFDVSGTTVYINRDHQFFRHAEGGMAVLAPLAIAFYATHLYLLEGRQLVLFPEAEETPAAEYSRQVSAVLECFARAEARALTPAASAEG